MPEQVRTAIQSSANELAGYIAAGASDKVRARTIPQFASDQFSGIQSAVQDAATHFKGTAPILQSLWLLDATDLKPGSDGTLQDGQFFCSLKQSASSVTVTIPSLPPGRYAVAIANGQGSAAWRLTLLLQEVAGRWQLAGLFPEAMTMGGHDGLWYWNTARSYRDQKQPWNAWISYQIAHRLLQPAPFMTSSHLDKLDDEMTKAAPAALSQGVSSRVPLVLKTADGQDLFVTDIAPDDSLGDNTVDVGIHIRAEAIADPVKARARNRAAALAFARAYPELRNAFHGIWVYADAPGQPPFATEEPFANLQ